MNEMAAFKERCAAYMRFTDAVLSALSCEVEVGPDAVLDAIWAANNRLLVEMDRIEGETR